MGRYYYNARWYDAGTGRFISEDPARDGANWFIYCSNNPIQYIDPTGMWDSSGSANDNPYDDGGDATRSDNTNSPRGSADDDGGSKEPKPEDKDKPEIFDGNPWNYDLGKDFMDSSIKSFLQGDLDTGLNNLVNAALEAGMDLGGGQLLQKRLE